MPQTFDEEIGRSIWSKDDWINCDCLENLDRSQGTKLRNVKIVRVRDYKDRFIFKSLQIEARKENPGFKWYKDRSQDAFIAWSIIDGAIEPSGYVLTTKEFFDRTRGAEHSHWYPETLNQLFVRKSFRRNGVGTALLKNHISSQDGDQIWVESPKWETRTMLTKFGYEETNDRYEIWQMREGLTRWDMRRPIK